MSRKYFGTDGIRGRVGDAPMMADFVLKLGWAAGRVLAPQGGGSVLIGKDTRISGYLLESALEAGLASAGVDVRLLGPMPSPAIAYLTRTFRAQAGIVISASHNPYYDNGVKFFGANGMKMNDDFEQKIESLLEQPMSTMPSERLGKAGRIMDASGRYVEFCKHAFPGHLSLDGLKVVLDCANGAAYQVAPQVFRELGADVVVIGNEPNGLNINAGCGSTHPEWLQRIVKLENADIGIALDGDADRVLVVDDQGELLDGDQLLYLIAMSRHRGGHLHGPVVGTVMSNLGLEKSLNGCGIEFMRAKVGDRHVLELLNRHGGNIGGESSGHLLCLDKTTTGDGIISALEVVAAMLQAEKPLRELVAGMARYPQVMINVPIAKRVPITDNPYIDSAVTRIRGQLNGSGRVVLRSSGTEPVVRVMVEGDDHDRIHAYAEELAEIVTARAA